MPESFPFMIYSGLLTGEHREKIGPAIWEFLWCISKTTREIKEDDENWGIVLGGKPVKHAEIADDLGTNERTIRRNMARLKEEGYIDTVRAPYGEIIRVRNSKKFIQNRTDKNGLSPPDRTKMSDPDCPHLSNRTDKNGLSPDKNVRSNKDIISDIKKINNAVVVEEANAAENKLRIDKEGVLTARQGAVPATSELGADTIQKQISESNYRQTVADRYIFRRGKGLQLSPLDEESLDELLVEGIPIDTALDGIEKAFNDYKPLHKRDRIHSLSYCLSIIYDLHYKKTRKIRKNGGASLASVRESDSRPFDKSEYFSL